MEDRVKEIIAEQLGVDGDQVTDNASFTDAHLSMIPTRRSMTADCLNSTPRARLPERCSVAERPSMAV